MINKSLVFIYFFCSLNVLWAQDNYEIQVYSSPTQTKGSTMFELHSNYTFNGEKNIIGGVRPDNHALHETVEITQGITDNFEIGFYIFTNYTGGYGYQYVGSHIRPRIRVPEKWHWPFGASLSTEFGFQSHLYSGDTWSMEIRPILDKQFHNLYISFNPTLGIGLGGNKNHSPSIEPNLKTSYTFEKVSLGFEYYGDIGQLNHIQKISEENHAVFLAADLDIDPRWELNFGPGWGLTKASDGFIFKFILGRRINWKRTQ